MFQNKFINSLPGFQCFFGYFGRVLISDHRNGNGTSMVILYTHTVPKAVAQEAREIQALLVPEFTDPFVRTAQIDDFYEQLWKMAGELWEKSGKCLPERKTGKLRRRIRGLLGSLARDGMWESRI